MNYKNIFFSKLLKHTEHLSCLKVLSCFLKASRLSVSEIVKMTGLDKFAACYKVALFTKQKILVKVGKTYEINFSNKVKLREGCICCSKTEFPTLDELIEEEENHKRWKKVKVKKIPKQVKKKLPREQHIQLVYETLGEEAVKKQFGKEALQQLKKECKY